MTTFSGGGFYEKLGVRPFINLEGSLTLSGGFTPSPAVSAAMEEANARFCDMEHLLDGAGRFIADALGVEAAYVAPGGISALILSAAALMSGDDLELMRRLPDTEGMDNEFVVQASNKAAERAFEIAGGRVVYAGDDTGCTAAQLEAAIGPRTVAICQYFAPGDGVLPIEETRAVAQAHGIPLVVDGAATSRPLDLFREVAHSGDLVSFGGKYFGGPSATGFVCGSKRLVDLVAKQGVSHHPGDFVAFGRGYKLDRMQVAGIVVALDEWMSMDHGKRLEDTSRMLKVIEDRLEGVPGVRTEQVTGFGYADLSLLIRRRFGRGQDRRADYRRVGSRAPEHQGPVGGPGCLQAGPRRGDHHGPPVQHPRGRRSDRRRAAPPDTTRLIRLGRPALGFRLDLVA